MWERWIDVCKTWQKHGEEKELESENGWKWSETFAVHHRENSSALAKVIRPGAVFDSRNPRSTEKTVQGPPKSQVKCTICTKLSNKTTRDSIVVSWYPWPPLILQASTSPVSSISNRIPRHVQYHHYIIPACFQHRSSKDPSCRYDFLQHDNAQKHHNDTTKMKKTVHNKKKRNSKWIKWTYSPPSSIPTILGTSSTIKGVWHSLDQAVGRLNDNDDAFEKKTKKEKRKRRKTEKNNQ